MSRAWWVLAIVVGVCSGRATAATQEQIDRSIARGVAFIKNNLGAPRDAGDDSDDYPVGSNALSGLALLCGGVDKTDPAIITLAAKLRQNTYSERKTYNLALLILFFDRLGQSEDVPLIQLLGTRLLAGQHPNGGWAYEAVTPVPADAVNYLRQNLRFDWLKNDPTPPPAPGAEPKPPQNRLQPELIRYALTLRRAPGDKDDNSNTQFAILALWIARKHGLDTERALALIEQRFLMTQTPDGGWRYDIESPGSPSMICAGLLGIGTAIARRDERIAQGKEKKGAGPMFVDPREDRARKGFAALAKTLPLLQRQLQPKGISYGHGDLYYMWALERVCMIYKLDQLAGVDWYSVGADVLLRVQNQDGSFTYSFSSIAGTSLAILFLSRADLASDLKAQDQNQFNELRAARNPPGGKEPTSSIPSPKPIEPKPVLPTLPTPSADPSVFLAADLLNAADADWLSVLAKMRDEKGASFTRALVLAVNKLAGDRKAQARDALSERLTRMTATTLREMLTGEEPELRRAAVLAAAMKDEKEMIPDLIQRVNDKSAIVWPAARAGLKSLTGSDFGPAPNANAEDRRRAEADWRTWYLKQKK